MSFLSLTSKFHPDKFIKIGLENDCDMSGIIVFLGTLILSLPPIAFAIALYFLCKKDSGGTLAKNDVEEIELGIEKAIKDPVTNICTVGSYQSIPDSADATSEVGNY